MLNFRWISPHQIHHNIISSSCLVLEDFFFRVSSATIVQLIMHINQFINRTEIPYIMRCSLNQDAIVGSEDMHRLFKVEILQILWVHLGDYRTCKPVAPTWSLKTQFRPLKSYKGPQKEARSSCSPIHFSGAFAVKLRGCKPLWHSQPRNWFDIGFLKSTWEEMVVPSLKLTAIWPLKIHILPGNYHQNGGFSMAMLVYRSVQECGWKMIHVLFGSWHIFRGENAVSFRVGTWKIPESLGCPVGS